MTRAADVEAAVALGARYVGVIFAEGPRRVTAAQARELLRDVPPGVARVGVFGANLERRRVVDVARAVGLDIIQLHGDPDVPAVIRMRDSFGGRVWAAVRVRDGALPANVGDLFGVADAVVVDAYSPTALGGTGLALPWPDLAGTLGKLRGVGRFVLAGGLRPETVALAIRALEPDVVDVSSGVEAAPGIKDPAKLRAFRDAVVSAALPP